MYAPVLCAKLTSHLKKLKRMNDLATLEPEIVTVELDRRCDKCGELRLATEFQDAANGPLFAYCRGCRQGQLTNTEEQDEVRNFAKRLAAEARGQHIKSPHITEVNAEMFKLWDGVEGFCKAWFDQIQLAMVARPGAKVVLDQFAEMARLAKYATEHRSSAPDVASLTDEELGKQMLELAMSVLPAKLEKPKK